LSTILYQPFWCEENIWHLAQNPATVADERFVLLITGAKAEVACWQQRSGVDGVPVLWDYHVVLATRSERWQIWDLDGRLGFPVPAETWLGSTFPCPDLVPARFQPRFALIPAADYVQSFGSDRAHMRGPDGRWLQPPPPWPAITGQALSLADAIQQARQGFDQTAVAAQLR
jgi:hypothetical protein